MNTSIETSKLVIDPDGDVVLVLEESTELQVSSKGLSLASSVFKAMFSPHFQEGQDLSGPRPKRISLPEDDAEAMTTLCYIIHHRSHSVSKMPQHSTLVEIGFLCDKYDCSEALESWSKTWLNPYQQDVTLGLAGMKHLLFPFYAFNDLDSFKQISIMTVYHTKGFLNKPETTGSLPNGVLGKVPPFISRVFETDGYGTELLQRKKWEVECQLSNGLSTLAGLITYNEIQLVSSITPASHRIWRHHRELKRLGIWPLATALLSSSISTVCTDLEKYEGKNRTSCECSGCTVNLEQAVRRAGSDAMQSFEGLCLDCIKLGITKTGDFEECSVHRKQ